MKLFPFKPFTLLLLFHAAILVLSVGLLLKQKGKPPHDKEEIVVIPIEGILSMEKGSLGRGMSIESLVETLKDLREQEKVKAVVLRINSPGGSVGAVQEVYEALRKFRSKGKVIVSSFGDVAASGGYYIACAGNTIVSHPGTLTGSIGVVMQIPNFQGLMKKVGVSIETVKSGSMKDAGSPFREMSQKERGYFKMVILDAYDQFFQAVKVGRKMEEKTLQELADGRIFSGRMALNHKLIDSLGDTEAAIQMAKKLTGLENKNPRVVFHKEKKSLDRLLDIFSKSPVDEIVNLKNAYQQLLYLMP